MLRAITLTLLLIQRLLRCFSFHLSPSHFASPADVSLSKGPVNARVGVTELRHKIPKQASGSPRWREVIPNSHLIGQSSSTSTHTIADPGGRSSANGHANGDGSGLAKGKAKGMSNSKSNSSRSSKRNSMGNDCEARPGAGGRAGGGGGKEGVSELDGLLTGVSCSAVLRAPAWSVSLGDDFRTR